MVWLGPPHPSEDSYAHAKRAMLAQLIAYQEQYDLPYAFVISGNLYGPHDKFDPEFGHVTPSLVRKFHEARLAGGEVRYGATAPHGAISPMPTIARARCYASCNPCKDR